MIWCMLLGYKYTCYIGIDLDYIKFKDTEDAEDTLSP